MDDGVGLAVDRRNGGGFAGGIYCEYDELDGGGLGTAEGRERVDGEVRIYNLQTRIYNEAKSALPCGATMKEENRDPESRRFRMTRFRAGQGTRLGEEL